MDSQDTSRKTASSSHRPEFCCARWQLNTVAEVLVNEFEKSCPGYGITNIIINVLPWLVHTRIYIPQQLLRTCTEIREVGKEFTSLLVQIFPTTYEMPVH